MTLTGCVWACFSIHPRMAYLCKGASKSPRSSAWWAETPNQAAQRKILDFPPLLCRPSTISSGKPETMRVPAICQSTEKKWQSIWSNLVTSNYLSANPSLFWLFVCLSVFLHFFKALFYLQTLTYFYIQKQKCWFLSCKIHLVPEQKCCWSRNNNSNIKGAVCKTLHCS